MFKADTWKNVFDPNSPVNQISGERMRDDPGGTLREVPGTAVHEVGGWGKEGYDYVRDNTPLGDVQKIVKILVILTLIGGGLYMVNEVADMI